MKCLRELLLEFGRRDPRILVTHGRAIAEAYQAAGREYEREFPRRSMTGFNGVQQYEVYVLSWYRDRAEFQETKTREYYQGALRARGA